MSGPFSTRWRASGRTVRRGWVLAKPEGFQQLYSDAIALVVRDADVILGKGVVTHVVDLDEEAFLREIGPDVERPPGHLIILGHSGGGFSWHSDMTWPDYVVNAAESIQEALRPQGIIATRSQNG